MFPQRLAAGYHSFLHGRLEHERERYEKLAREGQSPEIMVIGCGDSRVAPEAIFDAGPGEIFVIRNIANLVPPCEDDTDRSFHGTSAAIEFAVNALQVKHIVILGHARCGGVAAFANKAAPLSKRDFIGKWMSQIAPVLDRVGPAEVVPEAEREPGEFQAAAAATGIRDRLVTLRVGGVTAHGTRLAGGRIMGSEKHAGGEERALRTTPHYQPLMNTLIHKGVARLIGRKLAKAEASGRRARCASPTRRRPGFTSTRGRGQMAPPGQTMATSFTPATVLPCETRLLAVMC